MGESVSAPASSAAAPEIKGVVIEQADIYSSVLAPLMEEAEKGETRLKEGGEGKRVKLPKMDIWIGWLAGWLVD